MALFVKVEIQKSLGTVFIRPIYYPKWASNLVPISQPIGGIQICTKFRDINKAYLKDEFPLPSIEIIMDLTMGHKIISLMDGFLRYTIR